MNQERRYLTDKDKEEIYGKNIDITTTYGVISLRENGRIILS